MGSPPKGTSLDGSVAGQRKEELPEAVGLECPMGKITVIESRDGEHTNEIESSRHGHGGPAPADHEYQEASDMQEQKGQHADPVDTRSGLPVCGPVGVDPSQDRQPYVKVIFLVFGWHFLLQSEIIVCEEKRCFASGTNAWTKAKMTPKPLMIYSISVGRIQGKSVHPCIRGRMRAN